MSKVYSFDVFDTCLVRTCGKPINVIYTLAYNILGLNADFVSIRDFVRKRLDAERALYQSGIEAPTIDQIYDNINLSYYTELSSKEIKNIEMKLEESILVPVAETVNKIKECREKGRVLFISDMYFSSLFLRSILKKYGIIEDGEPLYVSCEYNASKYNGTLFDIVKRKENLSYNNWIHYGDDYHNDYLIPKKKGIKTERIVHHYLEYEKLGEEISPFTSDKLSISIFVGILRAARLKLGVKNDGGLLSDVMCGTLLPFVVSCLLDAKRRNLKRLYFASRDAYVMYLIAKQLYPLFPDIEIKYLYLSTRVIYPATIEKGNADELRRFLKQILIYKPVSIIKMFGFDKSFLENASLKIDIENECKFGSKTSDQLIEILTNNVNKEKLRRNCKEKKELLLDYLKQEGFLNDEKDKVGLVDIGWRCTSQRFLSEIIGHDVMYYYFGVVKENFHADEMGKYKPFFYTDVVGTEHPKVLECYICKNLENTVLGYERSGNGSISVLFSNKPIKTTQEVDFKVRKHILETTSRMYGEYNMLINHSEELFDVFSSRIMKNLLKRPSYDVSRFLANRMFWDHYVDEQRIIIKFFVIRKLFYRLFYPRNHKKRLQYAIMWNEACISYTYGRWAISPAIYFYRTLKKVKNILL